MLDIAQRLMLAPEAVQQLLQSDLPSERAACSAPKSGAPRLSSATASPSIMPSGKLLACWAMAVNFAVQSSPLRVRSVALPFSMRSCRR